MKKITFGAIFGLCLVFALTATGLAADTIKLGVAGPHSGDLASYGLPTVNAAKLVVAEINANGGVMGKSPNCGECSDYNFCFAPED